MNTIRAVDLPEVRAEMVKLLMDHGQPLFLAFIKSGTQGAYPRGIPLEKSAEIMARLEAKRLLGDLFYVGADMTKLCIIAANTLPNFTLMPEDLPSKSGIVCFEEAIGNVTTGGKTVYITAAAWGPWTPPTMPNVVPRGGVWISWYSDRNMTLGDGSGYPARLLYENDCQVSFNPNPMRAVNSLTGEFAKVDYPIEVLKSAWLLMQQPLVEASHANADRHSRKRIQRMDQEPAPVRIIQLRRAVNQANSGHSDREYHHQWIVRGHWRQQWYPTREVHRPVWIAPHVKGPEGAPILGGEKVHTWTK